MSARTSTKSARPPARSIVSGEVASSREMLGRALLTATLAVRARLSLGFGFALGLAVSRVCARVARTGAGDGAG
jgi:hypothetical protein